MWAILDHVLDSFVLEIIIKDSSLSIICEASAKAIHNCF